MTAATSSVPVARTPNSTTLAAAGVALAAVVIFAGNYNVPKGENGGVSDGISTAVLCAVIAAVLFLLVLPRVRNAARTTVVLGVLSVLSLAAFWSGVTPILAAATVAAASAVDAPARGTAVARGLAVAATALAVGWTLANSHL